jgi:hypothetical protein
MEDAMRRKATLRWVMCGGAILFLLNGNAATAQVVASGFHEAFRVPPGPKLVGGWLVIAGFDLDNDGNQEFIWVEDPTFSASAIEPDTTWGIHHWEATGDNSYAEIWSWFPDDVKTGDRSYPAMTLGDVDKDSLIELYFGSPADVAANPGKAVPRLYVFEHDGFTFPAQPQETWDLGRPAGFQYITTSVGTGDLDNDGDIEIVLTSRGDSFGGAVGSGSGRSLVIASVTDDIGSGFANFETEFVDSSSVLKGGAVYGHSIVDFDGNSVPEVWVFTWDLFSWTIYSATAPNTYSLVVDVNQAVTGDEGQRQGVRFFDMDGDGALEMFVATLSGDGAPPTYVRYIASTNDVSTISAASLKLVTGPFVNCAGSAYCDLDGDNLMEFLFIVDAGNGNDQVMRLEYQGGGALDDPASYSLTTLYQDTTGITDLRTLAVADVDGDRRMDVLITSVDLTDANEGAVTIIESDVVTSVQTTPATPSSFALRQNYPNPFNPQTRIEFELPHDAHVELTIFDVAGREVTKLINGRLNAGKQVVTFEASGLPTGVYFYEVKADEIKASRKMIYVK